MKTWFTSDTHFGHENIIRYCNRPFNSLRMMDEVLANNWNARVKNDDIVIFLGDFCFRGESKPSVYLDKLNGHITFLRGNHDNNNSLNAKIESIVMYISKRWIYCTHRPENCNPNFRINLVGHVHEKWKVKRVDFRTHLVNVGVDQWKYSPVSFGEILKAINKFDKGIDV